MRLPGRLSLMFILILLQPSDFDQLKPIHIAGTKGKGSTSAFISSILARYIPAGQKSPVLQKVGLYTSPHLRSVRERIQINNLPLSEPVFAKYFFEVWDRLEETARRADLPTDTSAKPAYFRFLTLMALHTYMSEGVDTAIVECGIGGEFDSTNIIVQPTVTGITSLGIDHTPMLGSSMEEIAWHKAGIMKPNAIAFTSHQPLIALAILKRRADEKGVKLQVINRHPQIDNLVLGLAGDFQKINASLAVAIAAAHLQALGFPDVSKGSELPPQIVQGLTQVSWAGRCETRDEAFLKWHLDGGHTLESITVAGEWFATCLQGIIAPTSPANHRPQTQIPSNPPPRVLIFNQQKRSALPLLQSLHSLLSSVSQPRLPFTHVIFCSNITFQDTGYKPDLVNMNVDLDTSESLQVQREMALGWRSFETGEEKSEVNVVKTIEEAVALARRFAREFSGSRDESTKNLPEEKKAMVLVTGSLHLVGGVLEILETGKGTA